MNAAQRSRIAKLEAVALRRRRASCYVWIPRKGETWEDAAAGLGHDPNTPPLVVVTLYQPQGEPV